jgi:hypothetical protein
VALAGGRLVVSGQASATVGSSDPGYFDYTGTYDNLLRLVRLDGLATLRLSDRLVLVGDLRLEGSSSGGPWRVRPYAAFVRVRPWPRRAFDIQAGLIPPVFGSFSRRAYAHDNPLIGFPLAYQYLTSLRADAAPASADELLAMRGRGWRPRYSLGSSAAGDGLPLMDDLHYQSGIEATAGSGGAIEASASLTSGSLSVPAGEYARALRQVSGRLAVTPIVGLVLGASASRGSYRGSDSPSGGGTQSALGFDGEFSRGHWLLRAESVISRWSTPRVSAPFIDGPLRATGLTFEATYHILPGLYAAARAGRLGFSDVTGTRGTMPWDAPVRRLEVGAGYSIARNVLLKAAWQQNWRDTASLVRRHLLAAQVTLWF